MYGYIKTPILTDRYIIFVLIPILILISCLVIEIKNQKVKFFIFIFLLTPTVINNYIEIIDRRVNKPEFKKFFNSLEKNKVNNLAVGGNFSKNIELKLVQNYIGTLKEFRENDFKLFNLNDVTEEQKMIWVVCYEPLVGSDCDLPSDKKNVWTLIKTKQNHFLNSRLYEIK
tara:strand:+ start:117 stop:629 length:513 start_codon:yes stop_codon:yes gene_type:complete